MRNFTILPRKLPIINIGGTLFYADGEKNIFIDKQTPSNNICVKDILHIYTIDAVGVLFDKITRNICTDVLDSERLPINVIRTKIPPIYLIDPIGVARRNGFPDDHYILLAKDTMQNTILNYSKEGWES